MDHVLPEEQVIIREDVSVAVVTKGMALCKTRHATYDRNLMGITLTAR